MKKEKYFLNVVLIIAVLFMPKLSYTESEFKISFPLGGLTPYNAKIESVLDHSGGPIVKDNIVLAYTGDKGMCEEGAKDYKTGKYFSKDNKNLKSKCDDKKRSGIWGYMGKDGEKFSISGHCSNDPKENCFLWYDGHAGYDYRSPLNTEIYAATKGTLCVSTIKTVASKNKKPVMWRDKNKCIYGNDPINGINNKFIRNSTTSWDGWHTFYILHEGGYSTWYLHA